MTVSADAYLLHWHAIDFIADVVGDVVLTQWQPISTMAVSRSHRKSLQSRLGALLPASEKVLAQHRLVALMWQEDALLREKSRKRAKGNVGEAYRLSKDTISKWRGACMKELGSEVVKSSLARVGMLEPREFFPSVFGEQAGAKPLRACASAYQDCVRARRGLAKLGRPEKGSA